MCIRDRVGAVAGRAEGIERSALEHRRAAQDAGAFNLAGLRDDGLDHNGALNAGGASDLRIDGLDGRDQHACGDAGGELERFGGGAGGRTEDNARAYGVGTAENRYWIGRAVGVAEYDGRVSDWRGIADGRWVGDGGRLQRGWRRG